MLYPPLPSTLLSAPGPLPNTQYPLVYHSRYVCLKEIGRGGSSRVYLGRDLSTDKQVVIKQLHQYGLHPAEQAAARACFLQEARILAGLHHPRIPRLYDQSTTGILWYLILDYLEGEPLNRVLARSGSGGTLPLERVCAIGLQLCAILSFLHQRERPLLHRDLKPANILLNADDTIFLIDFGLAGPVGQENTFAQGTCGYAAPEQHPDRFGRTCTTMSSDIYSLGVVLTNLLTGIIEARATREAFRHLPSPHSRRIGTLLTAMCSRRPQQRPILTDIAAQLTTSLSSLPYQFFQASL